LGDEPYLRHLRGSGYLDPSLNLQVFSLRLDVERGIVRRPVENEPSSLYVEALAEGVIDAAGADERAARLDQSLPDGVQTELPSEQRVEPGADDPHLVAEVELDVQVQQLRLEARPRRRGRRGPRPSYHDHVAGELRSALPRELEVAPLRGQHAAHG